MPAKTTNSLRDKLDENQLDLSLMQLTEVPVNEISELPKGTNLDLSNNALTWLPENFPTLSHLIHLDLSKNQLTELPEYFGQLRHLRHLDLYSNQLSVLPVSFSQLKNLKWLDLKNNPLSDALAKAAGPCITPPDCATCSKRVVSLMQSIQSHQERERQKQLIEERKGAETKRMAEEAEKERIRAEKKAAKERRRHEARERDEAQRKVAEAEALATMRHEMERPRGHNGHNKVNNIRDEEDKTGNGCIWSILMFILGLSVVTLGFGISILWIYTGGQLDSKSIERAMPVIQKDLDVTMVNLGKKANVLMDQAKPYTIKAQDKAAWLWADLKERNNIVAASINKNLGPYFCSAKTAFFYYWKVAQNEASRLWLLARPYLNHLGEIVLHYARLSRTWLELNVPIYLDFAYDKCLDLAKQVQTTVNNFMNN